MSDLPMPLGVTAVMLPELDLDEQIALCTRLGVTHYTYRPRVIPEAKRAEAYHSHGNHKFDLTPDRLVAEGAEICRKLEAAGMTPFGTVPGCRMDQDRETLELHFRGAAEGGAGRVRCQPPPYPQEPFSFPEQLAETRRHLENAVAVAREHGVKLVIETHAGSFAAGPGIARQICEGFDPSEVGLIFDLPNYAQEGNLRPPLAVNAVKEYIDHCHVGGARRTNGEYDELGFRHAGGQMCALTESDLHIPSWLRTLDAAGVRVPLVIEDFTGNMTAAQKLADNASALKRVLETVPSVAK